MKKALIAMSGGVDSSVAALLMQQKGYECIGRRKAGKDLLFSGRCGRCPQRGLPAAHALLRFQLHGKL